MYMSALYKMPRTQHAEAKAYDDDDEAKSTSSEDHTSEEDDDKEDAAPPTGRRLTARRHTVMAAPLELERGWTPPRYPKSASEKSDIRKALAHNCLFSHLDDCARDVIIDAMQEHRFDKGDVLIRQGTDGDVFYLLVKGSVDYIIDREIVGSSEADTRDNHFGELALLYDAPRSATVQAATDVTTWALDRETFKKVLMDTTLKQCKLYAAFLAEVPILSVLTPYEKRTLADALKPVFCEQGQVILEEGSRSDDFYIISDGEVKCTKAGMEDVGRLSGFLKVSRRLGSGDFFGEIALISNEVRQATVTAVTAVRDTTVLVIDRETFKRLLGPMELHLRNHASLYDQYIGSRK
ncbi:cAMP-dependent protein kinase regulatory subunit [Achlya hypogyna]|uniref:cAMP-dependent protein kinase regulatory subunit n=1 Tax=Achlya hypogyna TaxID=1202772 RepID=A0A1V9YEI4_ACHHY|nr:cAMP-dependent protein kinase regulatory subunit [Achlya hypogyna]